jgi:O-antigen/teichoic acid export membrane protein
MKIAHSIGLYGMARVISGAAPFMLLPILTRALGVDGYGNMGLFMATIAFAVALFNLSTDSYVLVSSAKDMQSEEVIVSKCFLLLSYSALVMIILTVFMQQAQLKFITPLGNYIYAVPLCAYLWGISDIYMARLQVRQRVKNFMVISFAMACTDVLVSIALVVFLDVGWFGRIVALILSRGLSIAIAIYFLKGSCFKLRLYRFGEMLPIMGLGASLLTMNISRESLASINRFFIAGSWSSAEVGAYVALYQLSSIMGMVFSSFITAWNPKQFRILRKPNLSKAAYLKVTFKYTVATVFVYALFGLFVTKFAVFVLGEKYSEANLLAPWIIAGIACFTLSNIGTSLFIYLNKRMLLVVAYLTAMLANIGMNFIFVPEYGALGAAYATFLSYLLLLLTTSYFGWVVFNKHLYSSKSPRVEE